MFVSDVLIYFNFRLRFQYRDGIRSATLSKTKSGNFFLSILIELPNEEVVKFKLTDEHVGIDFRH